MKPVRFAAALTLSLGLWASPATAQEAAPPITGPPDPRAELEALFAKVEKRLARMSQLLGEASAGDTSALGKLGGAGIDELIRDAERPVGDSSSAGIASLLEATQSQGQRLVEEIDRVLEIAREQAEQQGSPSGSGGQGGQPSPGQGEQPQQGQTPEGSRAMEGETAPRAEGQQPDQRPGDGEDPRGNQDNPPVTPEQRADAPPGSETGAASGDDAAGQWGELPVHVRRVFRNGVSEDVPPRYRDWIDAYHRKLSGRSGN